MKNNLKYYSGVIVLILLQLWSIKTIELYDIKTFYGFWAFIFAWNFFKNLLGFESSNKSQLGRISGSGITDVYFDRLDTEMENDHNKLKSSKIIKHIGSLKVVYFVLLLINITGLLIVWNN